MKPTGNGQLALILHKALEDQRQDPWRGRVLGPIPCKDQGTTYRIVFNDATILIFAISSINTEVLKRVSLSDFIFVKYTHAQKRNRPRNTDPLF